MALLRKVDAVTVNVPDLDTGLAFYADRLGHEVRWRNDEVGMAGLALGDDDAVSELVLTTTHGCEPNWLVDDVDVALHHFEQHGGTVLSPPADIPVGRVAVAIDPFRNVLVLVELSKGRYDRAGRVHALVDAETGDRTTS